MRKLREVEEAKALMTEAMEWSVFTWLFQKSLVRQTADDANDALDKYNKSVKAHWSSELKAAYKSLCGKNGAAAKAAAYGDISEETRDHVRKVKEADEAAHQARMTAEDTFDEAERRMNTALAREGCQQAIHSWELHEKAIRRAEAVPTSSDLGK